MLFFGFKKSVSVSVCYSVFSIGISKVKLLKIGIGKNQLKVNRFIPKKKTEVWHLECCFCSNQLKKWQCHLSSSQLPRTLGLVWNRSTIYRNTLAKRHNLLEYAGQLIMMCLTNLENKQWFAWLILQISYFLPAD